MVVSLDEDLEVKERDRLRSRCIRYSVMVQGGQLQCLISTQYVVKHADFSVRPSAIASRYTREGIGLLLALGESVFTRVTTGVLTANPRQRTHHAVTGEKTIELRIVARPSELSRCRLGKAAHVRCPVQHCGPS